MKTKPFAVAILLLGLVAATNRYLNIQENLEKLHQYDGGMYYTMALNAPQLPRVGHFQEISQKYQLTGFAASITYLQRLTYPYGVGVIAKLTGAPLELVFLIAVFAILLFIVFNFDHLLWLYGISIQGRILASALLLLNPYFSRYYLMNPYMIPDLGLVFGVSVLLKGIKTKSWFQISLGLLLALMGRQTALMLFPALALLLLVSKDFKEQSIPKRLGGFFAALFVALIPYRALTHHAVELGLTSQTRQIIFSFMGLFVWLFDWTTQSSWLFVKFAQHFSSFTGISSRPAAVPHFFELINFVSRITIPWTGFGVLWMIAVFKLRHRFNIRTLIFHPAFSATVLFMALVIQPILMGPYCTSDWSRYAALGLLPLGLSTLLISDRFIKSFSYGKILILLAPIFAASFHHVFSLLSLGSEHAWKFALFHYLILICVFGTIVTHFSSENPDHATRHL